MAVRRKIATKTAYRSGFEDKMANLLRLLKVEFQYEKEKLEYVVPAKKCKYTPDFKVGNVYFETKGIFSREDRKKMLLIKQQHPEKEIIMVFENPKAKINKGSKTTYAMWCEKNGIPWITMASVPSALKINR